MKFIILSALFLLFNFFSLIVNSASLQSHCERELSKRVETHQEFPKEFLFEIFKTPKHIFKLKTPGDRLIFRMAPSLKELPLHLLSEDGKKVFLKFQREVNPIEEINQIANRFHVDSEQAKKLIMSNGDYWIRKMFSERNQGQWDQMIAIYETHLKGPWQDVAEAKLQAALAYNRRNKGSDRSLAIQLTDEVISSNQGKAILSEAYGIRGRIIKDMFESTKTSEDVNSGNMSILDKAIESYRLGFESNPMDYYPGINVVNLSLYKGTDESIDYALKYAKKVNWAVNKTLQRYYEKKQTPDFWLLGTALKLKILTNQWDHVSILLPQLINSSSGSMNIKTTLDTNRNILPTWIKLYGEDSDQVIKLKFLIQTFENALRVDFNDLPLTEISMSYISTQVFPDMEDVFETEAFNLNKQIKLSGVGSEIKDLAKIKNLKILSFHKFLQVLNQKKKPKLENGVLLAPTGPYKTVMKAISDNTGILPWWEAYGQLGLNLDPNNVNEFIQGLKEKKVPIYFIIPRNFDTAHKDSFTFDEYKKVVSRFSELGEQVHFVFGFEQTFPLDYEVRISEQEARKNYRLGVIDYFIKRFQSWLVDLGSEVKSYKFSSEFNESLYPLVYDSVLENLSYHKELRALHSHHVWEGTAARPAHIIDIGGGTGLVARQLLQDSPNRYVEIFDSSYSMTNIAKLRGMTEEQVHISDATKLTRQNGMPIESHSIDGATCSNMIYLLSKNKVRELFHEVHRVLKKGGRFTLSSMLKASREEHDQFIQKFTDEIKELEKNGKVGPGSFNIFSTANKKLVNEAPSLFSHEEINQMAKEAGFKIIIGNGLVYEDVGFFVVFEKE